MTNTIGSEMRIFFYSYFLVAQFKQPWTSSSAKFYSPSNISRTSFSHREEKVFFLYGFFSLLEKGNFCLFIWREGFDSRVYHKQSDHQY